MYNQGDGGDELHGDELVHHHDAVLSRPRPHLRYTHTHARTNKATIMYMHVHTAQKLSQNQYVYMFG